MPPLIPNSWTTDPEYIELLNFLIERTENVESPMSIKGLAREFKEKSRAALTVKCLQRRIERVRKIIHRFEHIDTKPKVKMLFALSASVNAGLLKELKKNALVAVDDKQRIIDYKANDGSLEFRGDHSRSAKTSTGKQESERSYRSLITSYFENKNDANAVPINVGQGEVWKLIEFITEKCENVDSPLRITRLAKDFVEKFRTSMPSGTVRSRIEGYGLEIQSMEFVDTRSKVQQLFGLSATVNSDCLEKLRKNALVEVDEKNRIVYYKANDGSIELRGDHSLSAKVKNAILELKRSHRSLIRDYFENKTDSDAVPKTEIQKEIKNLIEFIIEKCEQVNSPLSIHQFAKDFNKHVGLSQSLDCIHKRIEAYCREIQTLEFLDTHTKVKHLFSLSAKVTSNCLEKLRKDAHVEVDEEKRISYYKANDGRLELRGDHSRSAKNKIVQFDTKRSIRSWIIDYFENKNNADAVPENDEEKEMWNLIEFITDMCENVDKPLNIFQLTKDFNKLFGLSRTLDCIKKRTKEYCHEIQEAEFLDTPSKVKQLFGLSARLDLNFLKEIQKDADVEVDELNRITKYTANNGGLTLYGDHSLSAKKTLSWIVRRKSKTNVKKHCSSDGDKSEESEKEDGYSEEDTDEHSSEDFGSEFDSDDENDPLDKTKDLTEPSNEMDDFDNKTPIRNHSLTEIPIDDDFDFDPPTQRSHRSEANEISDDQDNDPGLMGNTSVKTRSGRLSIKRHLDAEFSYNLASSRSLGASMNTDSASPQPAKQKKMKIEKEQASISSSQSRSSSKSKRRLAVFTDSDDSEEEGEAQQVSRAARNNARTPNVIRIPTRLIPKKITPIFLTKTPGGSFRTRNRKNSEEGELVDPLDSTSATSLRESASRLHLSKVPEKLPCREDEAREVQKFIREVIDPKRGESSSSRNSSFSFFSTESEENMANQDAPSAEENPPDYHGPRIQEIEDYDYNPKEVNTLESSPIDNRLGEPEPSAAKDHNPSIEAQNTDNRADAVAPEPKPVKKSLTPQNNKNSTPPTNGKEVISQERPIKVEQEEPVGNPSKDVKPETTHNFKIKFFNAMKSLILSLDTPFLSNLQSNIKQKIRKIGRSGEMISNDEMILTLELLAARMTNHSVIDISEGVESVSLIQFFCYLKASILNSKMIGVEGLVENINKRIENSQNKRIPMEKVANALGATLDFDRF